MKCQQLVPSANRNGNCDVIKFVIIIYRHLDFIQPSVIVILVLLCVSLRREGGIN